MDREQCLCCVDIGRYFINNSPNKSVVALQWSTGEHISSVLMTQSHEHLRLCCLQMKNEKKKTQMKNTESAVRPYLNYNLQGVHEAAHILHLHLS